MIVNRMMKRGRGQMRGVALLCSRGQHSERRGFVLLLVLATLVIAAMLTAGVARLSMVAALDAIRAEEQFQQRWVRRGIQETILGQAERVLSEANLLQPGLSSLEGTLRLNDVDYRFVVADESAKANLNSVARVRGTAAVRRLVGQLSRSAGRLTVELRPFEESDVAFDSWGQVFDISAEEDVHESADAVRESTSELTCWGAGPLNIRRASDETIRAFCEAIVPGVQVEGLLAANRERVGVIGSVAEQLASARIVADDAERLQPWISSASSCWSLWLQPLARGGATEFHLLERTPTGRPDVFVFCW